jgi:GNAT superfamily N-acetyltransferase
MTLREATATDDVAIAACIGSAFPSNPKARLDVLRWQYRADPFGETASWVEEDDGRIVAHYSAFPMPYLLDGAPTVGANAVDAAILPSHQGRGLFTPLARRLYEDCAAKGMPIAVCYARNPVAMRGVARAGVTWMPPLQVLARRGRRARGAEVAAPPSHVGDLWLETVRRDGIRNGVDRGAAWWRWRYVDSPLGPYRFFATDDAAAVVLLRGRVGYVLELLATDARAAREVLRGAPLLVTVAVAGGPLARLARSAGMLPVPPRLLRRSAHYGLVDTRGRELPDQPWHVGWGDMDHL